LNFLAAIFLTLLIFLFAGISPTFGKVVFPQEIGGLLYEANTTKTYHFDQVGSTLARTDDSGKVIGQAEYSAYGLTFWKQGDMATPFLYNGQAGVQTDPNGLLNMRARYYSPYLMRFLNADPSGFSGGPNWFAYADGNPISKSDPFGLAPYQQYPVRQPTGVGSFFSQTLPDTAVAVYKGVVSIPGQIVDRGTEVRRQAQSDFGQVGDPISGSIVSSQWVIGAGFEFFGGMAGVVKTPENLYNAGEYHASREGLLGQHEQNKAIVEDYIFDTGLKYGINNPQDAYNLALRGNEISVGGQITGGLLRSGAISSSMASAFGGNPKNYSPIGAAVGLTNLYGSARGGISTLVDSAPSKCNR
jgi:RHS repeat-associated protein